MKRPSSSEQSNGEAPWAVDSAPYLAAFVANSRRSSAKLVTDCAAIGISGPLTVRRAPPSSVRPSWGERIVSINACSVVESSVD